MIEPTESEDKAELDRFCDALISIYEEIRAIEEGNADKTDNALKNAPHTSMSFAPGSGTRLLPHPGRLPVVLCKENKFWPSVARVNNTFGDRNLICTCEPVSSTRKNRSITWLIHRFYDYIRQMGK